ncbi:MAG: transposase [Fuerstiella sp.]
MIGLLKYGSGLPFNRVERLQGSCEIPLAASTQWDIVHAAGSLITPAYEELIRQAAEGEVVYNDDTTVRILELMGERVRKTPPSEDDHDPKRTGLFTSGVVATLADVRVALFFSGRQHAGENLSDVLQHRATERQTPIQMCDGLARNLPRELDTILSNCLAHGRRNFVEIYDRFPEECRHVIEAFKVIYHNDKVAHMEDMPADARLAWHQTRSKPTMDNLHAWLQHQFDDKLLEPNSALGYPFEQIEHALKACAASHDIEIVPMDSFELKQMIGDVCRSINQMNGGATQDRLLDLCDRLEAAEAYGDGMLDEL